MQIRPYLVVPNLIAQPTWGGKYIAKHKQITQAEIAGINIGQSYELYESSNLSKKISTGDGPILELGNPNEPARTTIFGPEQEVFSVNELIRNDPTAVLGEKGLQKHGNKVQILIKYTQAQGNSYQLHVRKKTDKWQSKPESWYYLEPGLITLGVKTGIDWNDYQAACVGINDLATDLSQQVKNGSLAVAEARVKLQDYIASNNPEKFVNVVKVAKNQAIDLSACGIHHSWEEEDLPASLGNIVYEVQKNVYDPVSTIRSFDKGKIKDDGSIRPLQIDDYFKYIDKSPEANDPQKLIVKTDLRSKTNTATVKRIFTNNNYLMDEITLIGEHQEQTENSYHHLFSLSGDFELVTPDTTLTITEGYSAFVPAATGRYRLKPLQSKSVIFKTYL